MKIPSKLRFTATNHVTAYSKKCSGAAKLHSLRYAADKVRLQIEMPFATKCSTTEDAGVLDL